MYIKRSTSHRWKKAQFFSNIRLIKQLNFYSREKGVFITVKVDVNSEDLKIKFRPVIYMTRNRGGVTYNYELESMNLNSIRSTKALSIVRQNNLNRGTEGMYICGKVSIKSYLKKMASGGRYHSKSKTTPKHCKLGAS